MKNSLLISALSSLLLLAGCTPPWQIKPQAAPPQQAQAPTAEPAPEQQPPAPGLKLPKLQPPPAPAPPPAAKPVEPVHHKRLKPSPSTPETTQASPAPAAPATQQTASAGAPAAASAIGQLSEGGSSASGDMRNQTVDLIASVEHKLKDISRPLSPQEQKTAAQVRKFLQEASDALHSQDVDAAHTLATKASVLLEELLK